jgi:thioredoxin 1
MTRGRATGLRALAALAVALAGIFALAGCGGSTAADLSTPASGRSPGGGAKVTFVELGSNSCIPCKEMRPVMEGIQKTFGDQVNIVFYDVSADAAPAQEYGIQYIPTQVFLDDKGVESHRHTGFYPQEKIEALLVEQGLEKVTTQ